MSLIEKIQQQPRRKRLIILWASTGTVMLIISAIWLFSFSRSLVKIKQTPLVSQPAQGIEQTKESGLPSLFESIKKDFSDLKNLFNASVKEIDNKVKEVNNTQTNGE